MPDPHVPKLETFAITSAANVDPKGFVRAVDAFAVHPHGLYMRRGSDHPQFGYLESWLLPSLGLRANIFHFRPGVTPTSHRYLDVAQVTRGIGADRDADATWRTRDLYLDVVVLDGAVRVDDADELTAAVAAGAISAADAAWAIDRAFAALAGITEHDGNADAWLASAGCPVSWANHVDMAPVDGPPPRRVAIGGGPHDPATPDPGGPGRR